MRISHHSNTFKIELGEISMYKEKKYFYFVLNKEGFGICLGDWLGCYHVSVSIGWKYKHRKGVKIHGTGIQIVFAEHAWHFGDY